MTDLPPPIHGPLTAERFAVRRTDDVAGMRELHALELGVIRITCELGLREKHGQEGHDAGRPARGRTFGAPQRSWTRCRRGWRPASPSITAADVVRHALRVTARASVRFETRPREQIWIDFGKRIVVIAGVKERAYCYLATFGKSHRQNVRVVLHA